MVEILSGQREERVTQKSRKRMGKSNSIVGAAARTLWIGLWPGEEEEEAEDKKPEATTRATLPTMQRAGGDDDDEAEEGEEKDAEEEMGWEIWIWFCPASGLSFHMQHGAFTLS